MKTIRTSSLVAAALLGTLGLANVEVVAPSTDVEALQRQGTTYERVWLDEATAAEPRATQGTFASADAGWQHRRNRSRIHNGPGWSQAQVQRMARKRRNQQRNKRAHRGGR